jgi:DNA-binding MarR family transcriptional regulator
MLPFTSVSSREAAQVFAFDSQTWKVLDAVGRWKRLDLQDLARETGLDRHTAKLKVGTLKSEHLVGELAAPIDDFTVYYLTPEGVQAYDNIQLGAW